MSPPPRTQGTRFPAERIYRPHVQLIPAPLWAMNMRELLTRNEWRKLRLALIERFGLVCATCGKAEELPRKLSAHEQWQYNERTMPATARIVGVSLVCWHCHACEHWGCTNSLVAQGVLGQQAIDSTIEHFCRVNAATPEDFRRHQIEAYAVWMQQNARTWLIDYGPFEEWTFKRFECDPLNDRPWPRDISARWDIDGLPTMFEIIEALQAPSKGLELVG
jgi:hypothetical protein